MRLVLFSSWGWVSSAVLQLDWLSVLCVPNREASSFPNSLLVIINFKFRPRLDR